MGVCISPRGSILRSIPEPCCQQHGLGLLCAGDSDAAILSQHDDRPDEEEALDAFLCWDTVRAITCVLKLSNLTNLRNRVSGVSIWRLAACIEHKAATSPTFDPTWYGVPVIVLGMMEVNAASICACVPVFWPALTARMDQIFVTQEIKITRERRFSEEEGDDEIELQDSHSRTPSMSSQHNLTKKDMHYMDDYVIEQVDPLRDKTRNVEVSTELPSKTVGRKQSTRSMY